MRRLRPESIWPELSASPGGPELVHRWEALLDKAPRLSPWLDQMLGRHRLRLQESGAAAFEIERTLWHELAQWLADFEALPGFAVSAIAVTLEDERAHEVDPDPSAIAAEPAAAHAPAVTESIRVQAAATFRGTMGTSCDAVRFTKQKNHEAKGQRAESSC